MSESIDEVMGLTDEELFARIGRASGRYALKLDAIVRGREIFDNVKQNLAHNICSNEAIFEAFHDPLRSSRVRVVALLSDLLSGYLTGVAPMSAAVLLYRHGLQELCETSWRGRESPAS